MASGKKMSKMITLCSYVGMHILETDSTIFSYIFSVRVSFSSYTYAQTYFMPDLFLPPFFPPELQLVFPFSILTSQLSSLSLCEKKEEARKKKRKKRLFIGKFLLPHTFLLSLDIYGAKGNSSRFIL